MIVTGPSVQFIVAASTCDDIIIRPAIEDIFSRNVTTRWNPVIPEIGNQQVSSCTTKELVMADLSIETVIAVSPYS